MGKYMRNMWKIGSGYSMMIETGNGGGGATTLGGTTKPAQNATHYGIDMKQKSTCNKVSV